MEKVRKVSRDFEKFRLISRSLDWFREVLSFDQHWILNFSILHMLFSDKLRVRCCDYSGNFLDNGSHVSHCAPKYTYICSFIYPLKINYFDTYHTAKTFFGLSSYLCFKVSVFLKTGVTSLEILFQIHDYVPPLYLICIILLNYRLAIK